MGRAIMRKISCLLAALLVLGLCACGNKVESVTPVDATMSSAPQEEDPVAAAETETNRIDITYSVGDVDDGSGGFNGDYRGYAFDEKTVVEEHSETCHICGGRGSY